ncbi:hypothetical protein ACPA9J_15220 [Pseudomonas aeruginosa]
MTAGIRVGRVSAPAAPRCAREPTLGAAGKVAQPFQSQDISCASAFGGSHVPSPDNPGFMDCCYGQSGRMAGSAALISPLRSRRHADACHGKLGEPVDKPPRPLHADGARPARPPLAGPGRFSAGRYDDCPAGSSASSAPARRLRRAPLPVRAGRPGGIGSSSGGEEVLLLNLTGEERAAFRVPRREVPVTFLKKGKVTKPAQARIIPAGGLRRPSRGSLHLLAHSPAVEAQPVRDRPGAGRQQVRRLVARPRAGQATTTSLAALARSRQAEEDEA